MAYKKKDGLKPQVITGHENERNVSLSMLKKDGDIRKFTLKDNGVAAVPMQKENILNISMNSKESFPVGILVLSVICAIMFAYMIYNYVRINEHTTTLADLRTEITTLSTEINDLNTKLDKKNDLTYIEQCAREDYGMVSIDEIDKKYIEVDFGDVIIKTAK